MLNRLWNYFANTWSFGSRWGCQVRHRSRAIGTVLSVKSTGKGVEILIRFDTSAEAWMAFGYGLLEFKP